MFRNFYVSAFSGLAGLLILALQPAAGQALLHGSELSDQQAEKNGFKQQMFSFQAPSLDFKTYVPKNSSVTTMPYRFDPIEAGQIGRVLPVGKMKFSMDGVEFEDIIFSYRLRYPPDAFRTCRWQISHEGYLILHSYAPDELAEAQILGVRLDEKNRPRTAALAYCYARGDTLIAHYFMADLPEDEKQAENAVTALRDIVSTFAANMHFADGRPNTLPPEQIEKKTVFLHNGNLELLFPKNLDVVIDNTDKKTLPYEVHIIQKLQNGKMFSHLFLWINSSADPVTEEALRNIADSFTNAYISSQIKPDNGTGGITQKFVGSNSLSGYARNGISARSYQYKIIEKARPDAPTTFYITIIRYQDKLYVIYYHSLRTDNSSASEYFTGSASDVAYDMMRASLRRFLLKK